MREREPFGGGQDLDGAGGDAPVALVGGGVRDRDVLQGRASIASNRERRFSFTGKMNSPPPS